MESNLEASEPEQASLSAWGEGGRVALIGIPDTVTLTTEAETDTLTGAFLQFRAEKAASRHLFPLGQLADLERFTLCHRYEPFWMLPESGTLGREIPPETQYLLARRSDGGFVLLIPLIDGDFRCCLQGAEDDSLLLVAESGDDATVTEEVTGLFIALSRPDEDGLEDPYRLLKQGAEMIRQYLGLGERPERARDTRFGWCTWDAFYSEVSHEKVREGLESFRAGGVSPRYLILDDGWLSTRRFPTGESRLTAFAANEKFPGDLLETVVMAKAEFSIETFLVWHAVGGYWGGVDGDTLPGYGVRSQSRRYSPGIDHYVPTLREWFGTACGVVPPEHIYRFYQDFHRHLRLQGVDGVKVDNQSSLEGLASGLGGRVALMRAYHEALEGSVHVQFGETGYGGSLINCMSLSNEMIFSAREIHLTRTSTDFWPNKPESHGLHLYTNTQVSAFFGHFLEPDWDMFQSGHSMGAYHAMGRAVGGCPVYVSDKPGEHNFEVLQKLVTPRGEILRCGQPGLPTLDCLFHNPTREEVLLKIWNWNRIRENYVLGVFHARYGEAVGPISGEIRPTDIPGLVTPDTPADQAFALYAHKAGELRVLKPDEAWQVTLEPLEAEVFTIVPIKEGEFAAIGLANYYNSGGAVFSADHIGEFSPPLPTPDPTTSLWTVYLNGGPDGFPGARFVAWCFQEPTEVRIMENPVPFTYHQETGRLEVPLEQAHRWGPELTVVFARPAG